MELRGLMTELTDVYGCETVYTTVLGNNTFCDRYGVVCRTRRVGGAQYVVMGTQRGALIDVRGYTAADVHFE